MLKADAGSFEQLHANRLWLKSKRTAFENVEWAADFEHEAMLFPADQVDNDTQFLEWVGRERPVQHNIRRL
jgi:hypothetical protein